MLEVLEVKRCVPLCMMETVEGEVCLLEMLEVMCVCYSICWRL